MNFLKNFQLDFWTLWGLFAQGLFFTRLIIQWYLSERAGKTVVPLSFWYLGIIGAIMLLTYALIRGDIVFLITAILQIFLYSRNLKIAKNHE